MNMHEGFTSVVVALAVCAASAPAAKVVAAAQPKDIPARGSFSLEPAKAWEFAFVSGNGRMGAMVFGDPTNETVIANHCRLFLPLGSREIVPDLAKYVPELRKVIREQGYEKAMDYFLAKAGEQGFPGIIATDPFHPGLFVNVRQEIDGPVSDYLRTENFQTGEVQVRWRDAKGPYSRRLFVSRTANVIVLSLNGPGPGKLNCELLFQAVSHNLVQPEQQTSADWVTYHNVYARGKGGYDAAVRIITKGGQTQAEGDKVKVSGADEVLLLMRIVPWKTPLPKDQSEAWAYSTDNPDFAEGRLGIYKPVPPLAESSVVAYRAIADSSALMPKIKEALGTVSGNYTALLEPHAKAHGELFNRVTLDLGGGEERNMSSEALLDLAAREQRLPAALLEKMFDAGRYMFICSAGELPPNLQGIWTGTWQPAWSGDFTTDTNVELAMKVGFSGNLVELVEGYLRLVENAVPEFQLNAKRYCGCRGLFAPPRMSNTGLMLHWGSWPGIWWTDGASWLTRWFPEQYRYTGDKEFAAKRALPLLKEVIAFYEDYVYVNEKTGKYEFFPSYSPESWPWGATCTMDVMAAKDTLMRLIEISEDLGIEKENIPKWRAMLEKMPPYRVNPDGVLTEWIEPNYDLFSFFYQDPPNPKPAGWAPADYGESYGHRHLSHLHAAYEETGDLSQDQPEIWRAAQEAVRRRINSNGEQSSHGRMHMGLAAAYLRLGPEAYGRLKIMATRKSMYPSLITSHEPDQKIFNTDANGSIPEIVNRMLVLSQPGKLDLLAALPPEMPKGEIRGVLARGRIKIDRLAWDKPAGKITLELSSGKDQTLTICIPQAKGVKSAKAKGAEVAESAKGKNYRELILKADRKTQLDIEF